jgi:carbamoyltransferase
MSNLNVLSLNFGHDGSASVIKSGKLVAHIASERITRFKKQRGVNKKVIKYVLDKANLKFDDINMVSVVNWFWDRNGEGVELFDKDEEGFSITKENGVDYTFEDFAEFYQDVQMTAQGVYTFSVGDQSKPCFLIDHHFAHCCYSYMMSPYKNAYATSVDVNDNMGNSHSIYYFNEDGSWRIIRKGGDFGIGGFYSQICEYLGFYPSLTDAGKVMALAAYREQKDVDHIVWPKVVQIGDIYHGDQYMHLLTKHGVKRFPDSRAYYPQLKGEGGKPDTHWLKSKNWDEEINLQIASDAQYVLEESVKNMLDNLANGNTLDKNICVAGGTFLNCVMNGKLQKETAWNVYASPACGDDGLSIGAGLFLSTKLGVNKNKEIEQKNTKRKMHSIMENIEGGKRYGRKEIENATLIYPTKKRTIEEYKNSEELFTKISDYLQDGKIVGWFQGGSEIGPRALGQRSILADPRNKDMQDILNKKVKHRENFRPFAPMILEENAGEWFDCLYVERTSYPYMLHSFRCHKPAEIPSAVHVDGTARIQTVNEENGKIHGLLKKFFEDTNVPVLINTSFNVMGEPIVETPENAVACFLNTEIDVLVMGNFVLRKE